MMEVPYHYQFRIIVIGDTMVGKSSLLKTFSEGTFDEMEPTVGVDFFSKIIEIKPRQKSKIQKVSSRSNTSPRNNSSDDNIIIKLQIWDTAGQERFKSIVTSYYRNSVGIVLVYDVTNRQSYDHLIDWFTEARRHVEPSPSPTLSPLTQNPPNMGSHPMLYPLTSTPNISPRLGSKRNTSNTAINGYNHINHSQNDTDVISNSSFNVMSDNRNNNRGEGHKMVYLVLGCKTDLESQRQVSYEDGQAFADMYGFSFIETSSKTNYNVNKAFQLLAEEIYDKISECSRTNTLHRTASGAHLTFDGTSQFNEGIRIGPLIETNNSRHRLLLEAQPVSGFLGGCC